MQNNSKESGKHHRAVLHLEVFSLFIKNSLINWACGTQVSYTSSQSDGDHARAADQVSCILCSMMPSSSTHDTILSVLSPLLRVWLLSRLLWWFWSCPSVNESHHDMYKVPASEAQGHTAIEHNAYHGLYECSWLCSFVLLFPRGNWGRVSECVDQALVAHR